MNDGRTTSLRVGFRSAETWGIIGVLFAAGLAIGLPLGMWWQRMDSESRFIAQSAAYAEAMRAKDESINMCINKALEAANKAETAVDKATGETK